MIDPVMAADGISYERLNIEDWFEKHDSSPMSNEKLENKNLIPNYTLKNLI
jgi:hypothetical protein